MQFKDFLAAALCTTDIRLRRGVLFLSVLACLLCGCECDKDPIFEYPVDGGIDPTLVSVNITYHPCGDIPYYKTVYLTRSNPYGTSRRYHYQIFSSDGTCVKENIIERAYDDLSDVKVSVSLPAGTYSAVMWQDVLTNNKNCFYESSSLKAVTIPSAQDYYACTDTKDASCLSITLDVPASNEWNKTISYEVDLERPVSKITVLSTDATQFVQRCAEYFLTRSGLLMSAEVLDRVAIQIDYQGYILTRYNVMTDEFHGSALGYSYQGMLQPTGDADNLVIGTDYIFVNGVTGTCWIKVKAIDIESDEIIMETDKIEIPLRRGHETIVSGDILTMYWGQGVSIDTHFSGEFDIVVQ